MPEPMANGENGPPPVIKSFQTPPSKPRVRWWIHLVLIAVYPIAIGMLAHLGGPRTQPALGASLDQLLLALTIEFVVFGLVFGTAWLASRASSEELLLKWRPGPWVIPLGIGYSVALRFGVGVLVMVFAAFLVIFGIIPREGLQDFFLSNRPDIEAVVDVNALRNNPLYFWFTVTVVSFILGGLREELWRSGFLAGMKALWPDVFGSRLGQIMAVGLAAVSFGLGHLAQGLLAVGLTALLGIGLGIIMVMHRSIWPAVIAHGMFNATSLALVPWVIEKLPPLR